MTVYCPFLEFKRGETILLLLIPKFNIIFSASVFSCHLAIKSFAGLKLPPDKPPYNLPKNSPVEFEVQFKDPQKLVTNVSTDWAFHSQKWNVLHYIVTEWPNGTMYHMFPEMGVYMAEVTVRATLKGNQKWPFVFVKKLIVKGW